MEKFRKLYDMTNKQVFMCVNRVNKNRFAKTAKGEGWKVEIDYWQNSGVPTSSERWENGSERIFLHGKSEFAEDKYAGGKRDLDKKILFAVTSLYSDYYKSTEDCQRVSQSILEVFIG